MKSESSCGLSVPSLMLECECKSTFNLDYFLFQLAPLDLQRNRSALALVDRHDHERRRANHIELRAPEVGARNRDRFDRLVNCARTYGLNFRSLALAKDGC